MTLTLGGLLLLLSVVALAVISYKVREHSGKIKKLEEASKK